VLKNCLSIRASNTGKSIKQDVEILVVLKELLDQCKIKDILKHIHIVGGGINDLHFQRSICLCTNCRDVDFWNICDLVGGEFLRSFEDVIGNGLRSWSTIRKVVFDAEIILGT
jgi:hypothetical protein